MAKRERGSEGIEEARVSLVRGRARARLTELARLKSKVNGSSILDEWR